MEYIKYTQMQQKEWDARLQQMPGCPFNYTSAKIEFDVKYSKRVIANEAFFLQEGKRILAAVVIYIEIDEGQNKSISWNGGYCPGIYINGNLSYKEQEKCAKITTQRIDEIARDYQCGEIWLRIDPLANPEQGITFYNCNFLLKYGYIDNSSLTQMIDLRKDKEELYSDIRKGHKSDIKKGKQYEIEIYDASNITKEQIELYRSIYEADAGMVTRNSQLYMDYFYFIKDDLGALALAKHKEEYVGAMIVTFFQNTAYYSSYGELTEQLGKVPVGHAMQWKIIQYLKEKGIVCYEMGEQFYGDTHYSSPDIKLKNISSYKRGFGGYTHPYWRGKKIIKKTC